MKARWRQWWAVFWRLAGGVSVRVKIMGITLGLVLLLGLVLTWQVRTTMTHTLTAELEQRGVSIARDLAARSTDLVLTNNLFALYELIHDTVTNDQDVRYAFVLSPEGEVLAHSFGGDLPLDLVAANTVRSDQHHHLEVLDTEEGLIRDVAVPIFQGRAGVARVGMSEQRLHRNLNALSRRLLLVTLLVSLGGVALSTVLTWILTRPVLRLVDATQAVARGDLSHKVTPWADDEIGQLEASFNVMAEDLARAREETEAYNRRLLRRNRELSALNAVAQAVSGSLSLSQALERALEQVLDAVDSDAGWICLLREDGTCRAFAVMRGLCQPRVGEEPGLCLRHCACRQALETGRPVLIHPLSLFSASLDVDCQAQALAAGLGSPAGADVRLGSPAGADVRLGSPAGADVKCGLRADCPLLSTEMERGRPLVGHVAVPLLVKARAVGLLNVACHRGSCFQPDDLNLLSAVGRQLGVAIENTRLWEEVRRKEALRGELLRKVITAQEEERRRIARELHDETGQVLTSLLVGLKVVEEAQNLSEARHLAGNLKNVVSQTLEAVRNLALELRPSMLDDLGLVPALARYVQSCPERFGFEADFAAIGLDGQRLPSEIETTLYRIVQEALTNAARHAQARRVSVLLERRGDSVVAIVEDDGKGFDVAGVLASEDERRRLGLYGMEERASLVGGQLTVESAAGAGTTVFVEVPLSEWRIANSE